MKPLIICLTWFERVNRPLQLGITTYQTTTVEQIVSSILFFLPLYWFNLNASIRNSESFAIFKSRLLLLLLPFVQFKATYTIYLIQYVWNYWHVCVSVVVILMNTSLDIIFKTVWISYVLVVCRLKIQCVTFCTAIIFLIVVLLL